MANNLFIKETKNTPLVQASVTNGELVIVGKSFPENANDFYNQIIDWIIQYRIDKNNLTIHTHFYYVSSSSIISFLKLLKKVETLFAPDNICLNWKFDEDDDDIEQVGIDYSKLFEFKINLLKQKEE